MRVTQADIQKLALKLIETFSWQDPRRRGFERYWPLAGPVETFSEHASGPLEQEMAKALHRALEAVLRQTAPRSFHLVASSVAAFLEPEPSQPRRSKAIRRRSRRHRR